MPKSRTKIGDKSFSNNGLTLRNSLLCEIRSADSIATFENLLERIYLECITFSFALDFDKFLCPFQYLIHSISIIS